MAAANHSFLPDSSHMCVGVQVVDVKLQLRKVKVRTLAFPVALTRGHDEYSCRQKKDQALISRAQVS